MFTLPERNVSQPFGADHYRSPHASYALGETPQGWRNVLLWCQNLFFNGTVRMAMDRIVSYFLTDIDIWAVTRKRSGSGS